MDKRILNEIDETINTEKFVVPIYSKHLQSTIMWSGFDKNTQKIVIEYLKVIAEDSIKHTEILSKIRSSYLNKKE